jgi:hypothetical protein
MMRRAVMVLALAGLPVQALAEVDWTGHWALDPSWCKRAGQVGENTPDSWGRDGVFGHEWSCDLLRERRLDIGQAWVLQLGCLEGGDRYRDKLLFVLEGPQKAWVIHDDGVPRPLYRCRVDTMDWLERG